MSPQTTRVSSLDLLKGIVMVVMALDHVRDYVHADAWLFDPSDPVRTTLLLYGTRWVTHFCAPIFAFLAGISAYLAGRKRKKAELSGFLIKRGLWLILIELTVVNFGWAFDIGFHHPALSVIWSLGASMVILAVLIYLPIKLILAISCLVIAGSNLLDPVHVEGSYLWAILHDPTLFTIAPGVLFYVDYTLLPWFAVMSLGYCAGTMYDPSFSKPSRQRILQATGLTSIALFFLLRGINIYGDPRPWSGYETFIQSAMSFMNATKYPPSLLYLLMTIGPGLVLLARTENAKGYIVEFFSTFGRVPFFYYIVHVYLIHLIALVLAGLSGFGWSSMILETWLSDAPALKGYGFSLWVVFAVWFMTIAILYPLCRRFDEYKSGHREKVWLSYL